MNVGLKTTPYITRVTLSNGDVVDLNMRTTFADKADIDMIDGTLVSNGNHFMVNKRYVISIEMIKGGV